MNTNKENNNKEIEKVKRHLLKEVAHLFQRESIKESEDFVDLVRLIDTNMEYLKREIK